MSEVKERMKWTIPPGNTQNSSACINPGDTLAIDTDKIPSHGQFCLVERNGIRFIMRYMQKGVNGSAKRYYKTEDESLLIDHRNVKLIGVAVNLGRSL